MKLRFSIFLLTIICSQLLYANKINLTADTFSFVIEHNNKEIIIKRNQDNKAKNIGEYSLTSRHCPPLCVKPMIAAEGVETIGLHELFDFMKTDLFFENGLLIDARVHKWYKKGTIPGSIHFPHTSLNRDRGANDMDIIHALEVFGAKETEEGWNFSQAANLVLWCNGKWCGQSVSAIKGLIKEGYPPSKLKYFRDGMEGWVQYGLNIVID